MQYSVKTKRNKLIVAIKKNRKTFNNDEQGKFKMMKYIDNTLVSMFGEKAEIY